MDCLRTIKSSGEFGNVYRQGRSRGSRLLVMYVLKNPDSAGRLGISVSRKVGNSVVRHRVRRLIRESFRRHLSEWDDADIVIIARREAAGKSFREIEEDLLHLGEKSRVFRRESGES